MVSAVLGIDCSERCDRLLAFAFLRDPASVLKIAHCLVNDGNMSAVKLAQALNDLPRERAIKLAQATVTEVSVCADE